MSKKEIKVTETKTVEVEKTDVPESLENISRQDKENILSKIAEVNEAAENFTDDSTPKGTAIEDTMIKEEQNQNAAPSQNEPTLSQQPGVDPSAPYGRKKDGTPYKVKPGSGKYSRGKNSPRTVEASTPVNNQPDLIGESVNNMLVPLVAKRYHKEVKQCMMSDAQIKNIKQFQPPIDFIKPSWPAYIIALTSTLVGNFMTAETDKLWLEMQKQVKDEVKKEVAYRMENVNPRRDASVLDINKPQ